MILARVRSGRGRATTHIGVLRIDGAAATTRRAARRLPRRPDVQNPGDPSGEATPVPIPNTEVKLSSAEDTERAASRENRSSPGFWRFRGTMRTIARWPAQLAHVPIEVRPVDLRR